MHLIKLNATESTNTFLKDYSRINDVESYTVVWTLNQTKGRGQMNAVWKSENGKNLTFSILVKLKELNLKNQFYICKAISLAVHSVLVKVLPNKIRVKWPNDIMAGDQKIAGILIENKIKKGKVSEVIIGIGLNVNQDVFVDLETAVSMRNLVDKQFDLEVILTQLVDAIKQQCRFIEKGTFEELDSAYISNLYKFREPAMFQNRDGIQFVAKIIGVSSIGKLQLQLENESVEEFDLKEIKFLEREN